MAQTCSTIFALLLALSQVSLITNFQKANNVLHEYAQGLRLDPRSVVDKACHQPSALATIQVRSSGTWVDACAGNVRTFSNRYWQISAKISVPIIGGTYSLMPLKITLFL